MSVEANQETLGFQTEVKQLLDLIETLKRKMKKYAQNFQFEEAALLRDQLIKLNEEIKK